MKLIEKIKNAIFEPDEDEFDESFSKPEEKKNSNDEINDIVKKIDIEKTIPKRIELPSQKSDKEEEKQENIPVREMPRREHRRTPVIFDEEDFAPSVKPKPIIKPEEVKKPLYGGYRDDKVKEKFKPSPNISPVYGYVGVSPTLEKPRKNEEHLEKHYFVQDKKPSISLDDVRQKAFGETNIDEDDDLGLLYEMKNDDKAPAVNKITLGDAEEYFNDLGLEYNVDYMDERKEKDRNKVTSRSTKNKELSLEIEEKIKTEKQEEAKKELEITKEQIKPKTAKEIKKVKKIDDADLSSKSENNNDESLEVDEKNLYDLIDMMYESK